MENYKEKYDKYFFLYKKFFGYFFYKLLKMAHYKYDFYLSDSL